MELRHVRTFLTLADELHFGRAAARLHVVQPAVSQTLKALEAELGTTLFARTRRKVALTAAGHAFLERARASVDALAEAATAARKAAEGETGRVVLRFTVQTSLTVVPQALSRFRRERPGVHLAIAQGGSTANLEELRAGRCDLAFVTARPGLPKVGCERISDEPLMVLLPRGHRLARRSTLGFHDISREPRILLSRRAEPELYALYLRGVEAAGGTPNVAFEVEQIDAVLAFVAAGLGIATAPRSVLKLGMRGLAAVPLTPRVPSGIAVVWEPETLTPAARRLLDVLREERDR